MAKKHVMFHYAKMMEQYKRLENAANNMQQAFEAGEITEDKLQNFVSMVTKMRSDMEVLSYVVFLLNIPKHKWQVKKWDKKNKDMIDYFKNAGIDKDSTYLEWDNVLASMEQLVKKDK